jgi:hypothetical protein
MLVGKESMEELQKTKWSVSLYEKIGRNYTEVGVFWEDEATFEEATEIFSEVCTPLPPAVAIQEASAKEYSEPVEFEIRICRGNRVVGTFIWTSDVVSMCIEDFKSFKTKKLLLEAELIVPEDLSEDSSEWDVEEVLSIADVNVISISRIDVVE